MSEWIYDQTKCVTDYEGFVYKITNTVTGRKYIGRKYVWTTVKGKKDKESNWKKYWGSCKELLEDIKVLGVDKFQREILHLCDTRKDTNFLEVEEQFKREVLRAKLPDGTRAYYNGNILSKFFVTTPESAKKISNTLKGTKRSEETKAKMSASKIGKPISEEAKANISAALKGKARSEEHTIKIAAALTGKLRSKETKIKLSHDAKAREAAKRRDKGLTMDISNNGLDLIKRSEGLRLNAYPDPGTGGAPWTIGYGTTQGIKPGMIITEAEAEDLLKRDVAKFEDSVSKLVKVKLSQNQFDALVSFTYNVGESNLRASTLLRLVNKGKYEDAANEFGRWTKAAGKTLPGLVTRREAEKKLWLGN